MVLLFEALSRDYHSGRGFARLPPRAKPHWLSRSSSARGPGRRHLGLVECRENLGRVALGLHLRPDPCNPSLRIDEERRARRAPVGLAVVVLLDPRAVGLGDGVIRVGQEHERETELLAERLLARCALGTDPPDVGAALVDRFVRVTELAR